MSDMTDRKERRLILAVLFMLAAIMGALIWVPRPAWPMDQIRHHSSVISLNAATATGQGTCFATPPGNGDVAPPSNFTWELQFNGSLSAVQVDFQGSLDGTNYYQLDTYNTPGTNTMRHIVNKPVPFVCLDVVSIGTGGGSVTGKIYVE